MTRTLAVATDVVELPVDGSGKKTGFALAASGLYIPASVLTDDAGATIDTAIAILAGTEKGIVTRSFVQGPTPVTASGSLVTVGSTVTSPVVAAANATITLSGTYAPVAGTTLVFEASDDNGTTWFPVACAREDSGLSENSHYLVSSQAVMWTTACPGFTHLRARLAGTGLTSGALTVRITSGTLPFEPTVSAVQQQMPRTMVSYWAESVSMTATDTVVSFTGQRGGVALAASATIAPASGKILVIQGINFSTRNSTTTVANGKIRLRMSNTGAAITTSIQQIGGLRAGGVAGAVANEGVALGETWADGIEIPPGYSFGCSLLGDAATGTADVFIKGYEIG